MSGEQEYQRIARALQEQGEKATVCHRQINCEQGGATVWMVRLADGFLLDCGSGGYAESRANMLAININRGRPELFTPEGLRSWPTQ